MAHMEKVIEGIVAIGFFIVLPILICRGITKELNEPAGHSWFKRHG